MAEDLRAGGKLAPITSAQRAKLRGMANTLSPILMVGKEGITEALIKQADDALAARELIKCSVEKLCDIDARAAANELASKLFAHSVQVIGRRFVLYRPAREPKIVL